MKIFRLLILAVSLLFVGSCDDIEEPFIEATGKCGDASLPIPIKQILVEEFTGHQCGNCPRADEQIELLKELYCDHVIPVSIHAGFFAETNTSGMYSYDYRTEEGDDLDLYFGASAAGLPNAIINRSDDGQTYSLAQWTGVIVDLLEEEPIIDININTSYTNSSRDLDIDIDVIFINAVNENLRLSLYFIEDSIKTWQKDYEAEPSEDIEIYTHNHVLRGVVNGTWGEEILNGPINANDVVSKSYGYDVNEEWIIENSSIVAFVYKNDTKEVLQASQVHIMP